MKISASIRQIPDSASKVSSLHPKEFLWQGTAESGFTLLKSFRVAAGTVACV